jgi:hypothetical protein
MTEIRNITEFPDSIPQAHYFRVYRCPTCPNAHIVLFNVDDEPFAQFVIAPENLMNIIKDSNQVFGFSHKVLPFRKD